VPDGRIDHLWIRVRDPAASKRFYMTIAPHAGLRLTHDEPGRVQLSGPDYSFSLVRDERPLTEHVHLAFTSGAFRRGIEHVLGAAGIRRYFEVVVTGDDVTNGKPDPEGFRRALAELNAVTGADPPIEPWQTVAGEDATGGAQAARAAGMRVAAIRGPGYDADSGHADLVIERLDPESLRLLLALGS